VANTFFYSFFTVAKTFIIVILLCFWSVLKTVKWKKKQPPFLFDGGRKKAQGRENKGRFYIFWVNIEV